MPKPFTIKGTTYRLVYGLLVDELQVKVGARYKHLSYVADMADALCVIHNKPRPALDSFE